MSAPNVEECLSAAAFAILTDDLQHSRDAQRWATRFLRGAAQGRPTAFQEQLSAAAVATHTGVFDRPHVELVPIIAVDFYPKARR